LPVAQIGSPPWSRDDLVESLEEFADLYSRRPIAVNAGGMKSPPLFAMWFALRMIKPKAVIESGVWKGQGTWFIEQACPNAEIHCLDINLSRVEYQSMRAAYHESDFSCVDWSGLPCEDTLLFFDDHQNAYERLKTVKWFGFRHAMFEDNYSIRHGGCYSLKQALSGTGFDHNRGKSPLHKRIRQGLRYFRDSIQGREVKPGQWVGPQVAGSAGISPNDVNAAYLRKNLEIYYEFPPVFKPDRTRWGDLWDETFYPTPEPLLRSVQATYQQAFMTEATDYTWICYTRLK
jgi:hypothetical protein